MKTLKLISACILLFIFGSCSSQNLNGLLKTVTDATNTVKKPPLSNDDVISGLKEALKVGTNNSVASSSKVDGFFRNPAIKIPWPSDAATMESKLREIGMGDQVDKVVETINHGAEEAAKSAAAIFIDAVTKLTITDGMNILKGPDNAATMYLKNSTMAQLKAAFKPIVHDALIKVELTKYWNPLASTYNNIPFVTKVNPDLDEYVTEKAIEGLFVLIAAEELKIRKDPAARITDILKKVFG